MRTIKVATVDEEPVTSNFEKNTLKLTVHCVHRVSFIGGDWPFYYMFESISTQKYSIMKIVAYYNNKT